MSTIHIGVRGKVSNGEHLNMTVLVKSDAEDTGGFFICQWWDGSDGPNERAAFDDWVETADDLRQYFAESGWTVEWAETQEP